MKRRGWKTKRDETFKAASITVRPEGGPLGIYVSKERSNVGPSWKVRCCVECNLVPVAEMHMRRLNTSCNSTLKEIGKARVGRLVKELGVLEHSWHCQQPGCSNNIPEIARIAENRNPGLNRSPVVSRGWMN